MRPYLYRMLYTFKNPKVSTARTLVRIDCCACGRDFAWDASSRISHALSIQRRKGFMSLKVGANRLAASVDETSPGMRPRRIRML
jgi:hypothetical protein